MKTLTKDEINIYFEDEAFSSYQESPDKVKSYLDKHIKILVDVTKEVKAKYENVDGFYVSSTHRPENKQSPHCEGRGLDVSRILFKDGSIQKLLHSKKLDEWQYFFAIVKSKFEIGSYNQVICPYGILDKRILSTNTMQNLLETHQDHFHLNISK